MEKQVPPALLKAVSDIFDAAVGLRDGTVIRFSTGTIEGEFVHLDLGTLEQLEERCPYPFRRGVDIRISDIMWCADAPEGSQSMEKPVSGKKGLFTPAELDLIICALFRQQTEFRSRLPIMEKYASPEHLANHRAKLVLGERLLEDLS